MRKLWALTIVTMAIASLGATCVTTIPDGGGGTLTVTLAASGATMAEAAGTVTITATLSSAAAVDVTVTLGFTGTATVNTDYTASAAQIVIPAGSTSGTITLTAVEDVTVDAAETVIVTITAATNATLGATVSQTVTITDNESAPGALNIVKTDIPLRFDAKLRCGTDLIAFGTGTLTGVSYVVPSTTPTVGTPVTDGANYNSKAFAVGGKNIFLAHTNTIPTMFQVSVFNTVAETTHTFPVTDIRLGSIPVGQSDAGHIQADGNYCAVVCDQTEVTDGKIIKVIDAGTTPPTLISFTENPVTSHFQVNQVAVNAALGKVIAATDDTFFVYSIANPTTAPVQIASPNGIGDVQQMATSGNYLIALDNQGYPEAILVDLVANSIINLTDALAASKNPAIGGTWFLFFADATAADLEMRTAVGTVPGPGSTKAPLDQYIDGSTVNNGLVGFAGQAAIVPDGSYIFLSSAYLQYSTGGTFTVPADPAETDPWGCPAVDVHASDTTVGFKTAATSTASKDKLGYIILP